MVNLAYVDEDFRNSKSKKNWFKKLTFVVLSSKNSSLHVCLCSSDIFMQGGKVLSKTR